MSVIIQYCTIEKELQDVLCGQYRENRKPEGSDMAKAQLYSMEQIQAAQKKLRALPPKKIGKTRAEVVEVLAGDIRKAMEKGHTPTEIRGILAGAGIQAPLSRLAALLKKEGEAAQKREEDTTPVQSETAGHELFTMPEKTAGR
jgi:uncharacterized protein YicC (UPF0701 family)